MFEYRNDNYSLLSSFLTYIYVFCMSIEFFHWWHMTVNFILFPIFHLSLSILIENSYNHISKCLESLYTSFKTCFECLLLHNRSIVCFWFKWLRVFISHFSISLIVLSLYYIFLDDFSYYCYSCFFWVHINFCWCFSF